MVRSCRGAVFAGERGNDPRLECRGAQSKILFGKYGGDAHHREPFLLRRAAQLSCHDPLPRQPRHHAQSAHFADVVRACCCRPKRRQNKGAAHFGLPYRQPPCQACRRLYLSQQISRGLSGARRAAARQAHPFSRLGQVGLFCALRHHPLHLGCARLQAQRGAHHRRHDRGRRVRFSARQAVWQAVFALSSQPFGEPRLYPKHTALQGHALRRNRAADTRKKYTAFREQCQKRS